MIYNSMVLTSEMQEALFTKEKVCFVAGKDFGDLEGHTMIVIKALYGLKSSGK